MSPRDLADVLAETMRSERARIDAAQAERRDAARAAGQPEPRPRVVVDRFGRPR